MRRIFGPLILALLVGCGGHEARTLKMRTALDVGDAKGAVAAIVSFLAEGGDTERYEPE